MKLYIMIHEQTDELKPSIFETPLNSNGKYFANSDVRIKLNKIKPNHIFSSPFLRTLETIEPYINQTENNLKINIDYALYDIDIGFERDIFQLKKEWYSRFKINNEYLPIINFDEIKNTENITEINDRIIHFITNILMNYLNKEDTILLITHDSVAKTIMNFLNMCYNKTTIQHGSLIHI